MEEQDSLLNFEIERRTVSENVLARPDFSHKNNAQVKQSVWSSVENSQRKRHVKAEAKIFQNN